jgi:two-component system, NarL family, sensor histidine kinase EvgS
VQSNIIASRKTLQVASRKNRPILMALLLVVVLISTLFALTNPGRAVEIFLTEDEKAWLAEHPEIRLAVDIDWAPFEFVDDQNRYQGMAADYIRLVESRLGIRLKVASKRPWPKMVQAVKSRQLDAFSLVVKTPQRESFVNFTGPYLSFPMVIFTLEKEAYIDGIDALHDKKVSVVKSYASHDLLAKNHPDLSLHLAENVKKGLEAVSDGRAFAFIGNIAVAAKVIREAGLSNLKVSGQTPYRFELAMAVRKDWPQLVPILQKALDSISDKEQDAIYHRWIQLKLQEQVDYRIIIGIVAIGLIVVLIILSWNRRLQDEVKQRQSAEKALNHERSRLEEIIWGTNVGTWEWDITTGETRHNERFAEIIGFTLEELTPTTIDSWSERVHPDDREAALSIMKSYFSGITDHYESESRVRHKDGRWMWVRNRGKVVEWSADGNPLRMSGTLSDITDRKQLDQLKSEFVSTVSHELRTPLTSIKGSLGLISGGALGDMPEKAGDMIGMAYKNTDRLINLVNDILDMEKLESGRMDFDFQELNLSDLVAEATEANSGMATQENARFVQGVFTRNLFVRGDSNRLIQVLSNLLSNAAKFSPPQSSVEISVIREQKTVRVSVKDQGPGIPEDFKDDIFGRFAQADGTNTREKGGTGLGLNISRSIIERHDGTIDFDTIEGVGSTFFFVLPLTRSDAS